MSSSTAKSTPANPAVAATASATPSDIASMPESGDALLAVLAKIRQTKDLKALSFAAANDSHQAVPFFQAMIWETHRGKLRLKAVSGASTIDPKAVVVRELRALIKYLKSEYKKEPVVLNVKTLPEKARGLWSKYLPDHGLFLPFEQQSGDAGMLLTREIPFDERESLALANIADGVSWQWHWLTGGSDVKQNRRRIGPWLFAAGLAAFTIAAAALIEVPSTSVGKTEIVAADPVIVAAPIDGVVDQLEVLPYQKVKKGQVLLNYIDRNLRADLELAEKNLLVSIADREKARQLALTDRGAAVDAELAALRVEQAEIELKYAREGAARAVVEAPATGMVLLDDADIWSRRPVQTGERILSIADTSNVLARIWIPTGAFTEIDNGDTVIVNLDIDPGTSLQAEVELVGLQAESTADGTLAYRIDARLLEETQTPRIGLSGTARVQGERTSLLAYITRRPWAKTRQWIGRLL